MSSSRQPRPLPLTLWYASLFVAGSVVLVLLTYALAAQSLAQRDQQIVRDKLEDYAATYARGGLRALAAMVQSEQRTAPERLFVRVVDRGAETIVLSEREGWDQTTLETASLRLLDGTLVQVGKSTEARRDVLARFRALLGLVTLSIVVIALAGGWIVTQSALGPITQLTDAVRQIIATGQTDARVPGSPRNDAISELTRLFNLMLDRIERLVSGMRGALDNVSHDLRTPLTRLRGAAEMALASPPDTQRDREALADCVEEADRVLVMLNTLMDISEAESGAMPLARERLHLSDVAERAVDLYRDVADAKGVTLTLRTVQDAVVLADRVRMEQVAANLIDNAVKYTPAGGMVTVSVRAEGAQAVLSVQDTGIGIRADELPRIWDRLFRADASRTERGLGLGLSLVKAIVTAHGGLVDVSSQPGQGSVFTVTIPSQM